MVTLSTPEMKAGCSEKGQAPHGLLDWKSPTRGAEHVNLCTSSSQMDQP